MRYPKRRVAAAEFQMVQVFPSREEHEVRAVDDLREEGHVSTAWKQMSGRSDVTWEDDKAICLITVVERSSRHQLALGCIVYSGIQIFIFWSGSFIAPFCCKCK